MTSLERPVVPDVGMKTARSSADTSARGASAPLVDHEFVDVRGVDRAGGAGDHTTQVAVGDDQAWADLSDEADELRLRCSSG